MKIEDVLHNVKGESFLWSYTKNETPDTNTALLNGWSIPAAIDVIIVFFILAIMMETEGFFGTIFSAFGLVSPLLLFPLWMWIFSVFRKRSTPITTRYVITPKGVYIQTGKDNNEQTEHIPLEKIESAYMTRGRNKDGTSTYNVTCRMAENVDGIETRTLFENVPDYNEPIEIINEAAEKRRQEVEAFREMNGGISDAEKFRTPTPLTAWRRSASEEKGDPLLELEALLTLARQKQEQKQEEPQMASIPAPSALAAKLQAPAAEKLQSPDAPAAADKPRKSKKDPAVLKGDPQQAFFGNMLNPAEPSGKPRSFLNPDAAAEAEWLEQMEDESVRDLQQELFGSESMQTHAFPDPTVNPLPELPEQPPQSDDSSQFLQQGF